MFLCKDYKIFLYKSEYIVFCNCDSSNFKVKIKTGDISMWNLFRKISPVLESSIFLLLKVHNLN